MKKALLYIFFISMVILFDYGFQINRLDEYLLLGIDKIMVLRNAIIYVILSILCVREFFGIESRWKGAYTFMILTLWILTAAELSSQSIYSRECFRAYDDGVFLKTCVSLDGIDRRSQHLIRVAVSVVFVVKSIFTFQGLVMAKEK